jgi:hypothetical protein
MPLRVNAAGVMPIICAGDPDVPEKPLVTRQFRQLGFPRTLGTAIGYGTWPTSSWKRA